jgi:hypothetical protein
MKIVDLIFAIRERMYIRAIKNYNELFKRDYNGKTKNEYIDAIQFYQSLSDEDKEHLMFLLKTVMDDTISNFLTWLDGAYYLSGQDKDVELRIGEQKMNIKGYLSDIWKNLQEDVHPDDLYETYK